MSASIFLLWLVSIPLTIHAISEPRGYLLNCGSSSNVEEGSLRYIPDDGYISIGNKTTLKRTDIMPTLQTLRFFPNKGARKYCYSIPVIKGGKYLVKTVYFYGGFDGGDKPPVFDQIIDGTTWSIVNTTEDYASGGTSFYEAIVRAQNKFMSVCLARNQHTDAASSPFISLLEVISVDDSVYNSTSFEKNMLVTVARNTFGSEGDKISFPDDKYNRNWLPFKDENPSIESGSTIDPSTYWNKPPHKAFATALTTSTVSNLTVNWPHLPLPSAHYYIALYFQDNRTPGPDSWRVFDVYVNGQKFYHNLNATTTGATVSGHDWPLSGNVKILLTPGNGMSVGPLINAGELFQILPIEGKTHTRDVKAIEKLKKAFKNVPEDWTGDPCLPRDNSWAGVECSKGKRIRIVSLNLTGFGLSGSLPQTINLSALKYLLLGSNNLSGKIPDLSGLKSLEVLHLENNHLEGSVPDSLAQLPNLHEIFLQNNKLDGDIPDSLKNRNDINIKL